ncbi:MAG TPA: YciI family protein [Kofleriaceae bacterium]|nr:YciI family protein [Kofleriaceae bacterium]
MSDFVFLFRSTPQSAHDVMDVPERARESLQAWFTWIRDLERRGHLKHPGQPLARTGRVVRGAEVTDGPFVEVKDMVLGFIVVEAEDITQAVALTAGCPLVAGGGSVEVRPVETLPI